MKSIVYILLISIVSSVWACKSTQIYHEIKNKNVEIDTIFHEQNIASFSNELYLSEIDYIFKKISLDSLERFSYNIELGIDSLGKVTSINFLNIQKYNKTDSLLFELLLNMPKWKPAQSKGKNINSLYKFRVNFSPQ